MASQKETICRRIEHKKSVWLDALPGQVLKNLAITTHVWAWRLLPWSLLNDYRPRAGLDHILVGNFFISNRLSDRPTYQTDSVWSGLTTDYWLQWAWVSLNSTQKPIPKKNIYLTECMALCNKKSRTREDSLPQPLAGRGNVTARW